MPDITELQLEKTNGDYILTLKEEDIVIESGDILQFNKQQIFIPEGSHITFRASSDKFNVETRVIESGKVFMEVTTR